MTLRRGADFRPDRVIQKALSIAREEGFAANAAKTRIRRADQRQQVTGILVNQRTTVPRPDYDRLRAILHNCVRTSVEQQNGDALPDFRAHLAGRIGWVRSLDPIRGARLAATFAQIHWPT